jgi:hypothetical protein
VERPSQRRAALILQQIANNANTNRDKIMIARSS